MRVMRDNKGQHVYPGDIVYVDGGNWGGWKGEVVGPKGTIYIKIKLIEKYSQHPFRPSDSHLYCVIAIQSRSFFLDQQARLVALEASAPYVLMGLRHGG